MTSRYYFQQELIHKPIRNVVYHLKYVLCFYEGEGDQIGFFEVWKAKYCQAFIKYDIPYVSYIAQPFEYDEVSIGFFDNRNLQMQQMLYLQEGYLRQISISLPTKQFKDILQIQVDEYVQEKYLINCMTFKKRKRARLVLENLGVFEATNGDICEDIIITSWNDQGDQIADAIVKKSREPLMFDFIDDYYVILYRQNFFSELLEFFIWDWRIQIELSVPIQVRMEVNICILRCVQWNSGLFENKQETKQEQNLKPEQRLMHMAMLANQNGDRHPIAIFIKLNQTSNEIFQFKLQRILLDNKSSMLVEVQWSNPDFQEITILYYSNDMVLHVAKYDFNKNQKQRIYTYNQNGIPNQKGAFALHTIQTSSQINEPELVDEIKSQTKMDEEANLTVIFELPVKLILWQFINHTNLADIYGDRIMQEVVELIFEKQIVGQKPEINVVDSKKEIKYEYIL